MNVEPGLCPSLRFQPQSVSKFASHGVWGKQGGQQGNRRSADRLELDLEKQEQEVVTSDHLTEA